jgi:hypothetical protein
MLAVTSCVVVAIVSWHIVAERAFPAAWTALYALSVLIGAAGDYSVGVRNYIAAFTGIAAAFSITFARQFVHPHVAFFLVATHAIISLEHLVFDNRINAAIAVCGVDAFTLLSVAYHKVSLDKKAP